MAELPRYVDLTTLEGLVLALQGSEPTPRQVVTVGTFNGTFCPNCNQIRRMNLVTLRWDKGWSGMLDTEEPIYWLLSPAMYTARCVQCDHLYVLVVHAGPGGVELAALPTGYGGLATPNCHPAVAYYLDQANRARSLGAFSAGAAMYRAALDQLLFHEGFEEGMLGKKIAALEASDLQPAWFKDLDPAYLTVINELGNGAIHPNDGDHEKQAAIDRELTESVDALFAEILDRVYERPRVEQERLAKLRSATAALKKRGQTS